VLSGYGPWFRDFAPEYERNFGLNNEFSSWFGALFRAVPPAQPRLPISTGVPVAVGLSHSPRMPRIEAETGVGLIDGVGLVVHKKGLWGA
jgi:hypothetical protein